MEEIKEVVLQISRDMFKEIKDQDMSTTLLELSMNSLDYIKYLVEIEKKLQIEFENKFLELKEDRTLGDIIEEVEQMKKKKQ